MSRHREIVSSTARGISCLWPLQQPFDNTFKIKVHTSYDLATLLLSVYPGEMYRHIPKETSARIFTLHWLQNEKLETT